MFLLLQRIPEDPDQHNHTDQKEDRNEMGGGEIGELGSVTLAKEIDQKIFHNDASLTEIC